MQMNSRAFGQYFDNPDDLFGWLNSAVFGTAAMDALNRSGVTALLLKGPATAGALASDSGLPEDRLRRLLDYLVGHEVIEGRADGLYAPTSRTQAMLDAQGLFANELISGMASSKLYEGLRDDRIPFELFFGKPVFEYFAEQPKVAASFGQFMGWMTRRFEKFVHAQHRFEPFETIADIGGSMGDFLLSMLGEYPGTTGILFDLPETIAMARPAISASPVADRVKLVGGSFFEEVPPADLYTMKQILHDWHDDECEKILGNIRRAINPGGRLAVIDHILNNTPAPDEAQGTDVAMMVWDTGRERKLADFERLFAATGFQLARLTRNPNGHSVIEAVPV
jgi:hypothetical protein